MLFATFLSLPAANMNCRSLLAGYLTLFSLVSIPMYYNILFMTVIGTIKEKKWISYGRNGSDCWRLWIQYNSGNATSDSTYETVVCSSKTTKYEIGSNISLRIHPQQENKVILEEDLQLYLMVLLIFGFVLGSIVAIYWYLGDELDRPILGL